MRYHNHTTPLLLQGNTGEGTWSARKVVEIMGFLERLLNGFKAATQSDDHMYDNERHRISEKGPFSRFA